jgi:hypothetical protein
VPELSVLLLHADSGREAGRHALPAHTRERLIADAELAAVIDGCLPNRGEPLDEAEIALRGDGIVAQLRAGGLRYERRFPASWVADDVLALVARLHAGRVLPAGVYGYRLLPEAPPADERLPALRLPPLGLPVLERRSLADLGAAALPHCAHPTILLPRRVAWQLAAAARANADVDVGLLVLAEPFLAREAVPCRLGVRVTRVVPLARGTRADRCHVRIPPSALAAVAVDAERGEVRAGLAHSHPGGEEASVFFLSPEDRAFASGFFHRPWQIQLVLDAAQAEPERAIAAFAWADGSLARVCFQILEDEDRCVTEGAERW